ncbi:hypothetical protein CHS0354_027654, partial [Potamilus streckersoni]
MSKKNLQTLQESQVESAEGIEQLFKQLMKATVGLLPTLEKTAEVTMTTHPVIGRLPNQIKEAMESADKTRAEIQEVTNIVEDLSRPELKTRYFTQQGYIEVMTDPVKVSAAGYQLRHQFLTEFYNTPEKDWVAR